MLVKILQSMNQETMFFIFIILVATVYFHVRFTTDNSHKAPPFLTTLGILGTFVGIAIGLLEFDARDVQKSVPALIEGIKVAVWASACGIFCALTIKLRDIMIVRRKATAVAKKVTGATVDDLANIMRSVDQGLGNMQQTLVGEIQSARQDNNNYLATLNQSMADFCNNVAEANARALVAALNQVMHDFNVKLNEQFGENFRQLNQASEKLLIWQQQYSQQMSEVIQQQGVATKNMAVASERYQALVTHAEGFNRVANSMSTLLSGLEQQRNQVEVSLRELASLINTASHGLPEIEKKILEMTRQLTSAVKTTNDEFNTQVAKMIEDTKKQVALLDSALSDELTKSLESFGRQLAALSQRFAQDYGPITERLQAVLKIGDV